MNRRVLLIVAAIVLILFAVVVVISVRVKYTYAPIVGAAMAPTLVPSNPPDGKPDVVLLDKSWYDNHSVERWDIVFFELTGLVTQPKDPFIMRIVGLPGETISISNGSVIVNGVETSSPATYVTDSRSLHLRLGMDITVPRDCYIVLGDNSKDSYDSRYYGPVPFANIRARAARIMEPAARARPL